MKLRTVVIGLLLAGIAFNAPAYAAEFVGVDEAVVEKFAASAGRKATPPLLDADNGDLGLFLFLTAGAVGGFVCGYCFRAIFPKEKNDGFRRDV
ncbi:MAG: hypothetical protein HQK86_06140 [Nitrospinae bacterium]|nr:hypothetical protein [Nitrospinota bacterium]